MSFKIASWNLNSIRARLPLLLAFLEAHQPDVVALQETKVEDADFPKEALQSIGFHCLFSGQKCYNGVALLARTPMQVLDKALPSSLDPQCRLLSAALYSEPSNQALIEGSIRGLIQIINLYAPNGASLTSDKYLYKLQWFSELHAYLQDVLQKESQVIVLGDFNIAPEDRDVFDATVWADQVLVSEPERAVFQAILSLGLQDSFREFHIETGHYTWWDYRQAGFRRNLGLRIDHILCSQTLCKHCTRCEIDTYWRRADKPSDHAPIIAQFENHFS